MKLPSLRDIDVAGKRVFVRADLDVPLAQQPTANNKQTTIEDDTRLKAAMPTIEYLLQQGATVIVGGHLGRPHNARASRGKSNSVDEHSSLGPVARWLSERFKIYDARFKKIGDLDGWQISDNLWLLENLRFYDGEEENDPEFAKKLASLADVYVNDAFSVAHRAHASVIGLARLLPHYAGLRLTKEVEVLSQVLENTKRPLVVIIGGAKVETKLPLVEKMRKFADYVLIGGKLPQQHSLQNIKNEKLIIADLIEEGTDITKESVDRFLQAIEKAATIVWNGPLGLIHKDAIDTEKGTREVAAAIAQSSAYKIVGGGDTIDYLQRLGIIDKFDFVSMGGGAMLAFLSGKKLPGIEALRT